MASAILALVISDTAMFWGFIALLVLFIGGIIIITPILDRKRREAFQRIAAELRMEYYRGLGPLTPGHLQHFQVMRQGHSQLMLNLLVGEALGTKVAIFDYRYTTGTGKNKSHHAHTLVHFKAVDARFPSFRLWPESFFSRVAEAFGRQDIDFPEHREFSRAFVLQSPNEAETQSFFDDELLSALAQRRDLVLEVHHGEMLLQRPLCRAELDSVRALLTEAAEVYTALEAAAQRRATV